MDNKLWLKNYYYVTSCKMRLRLFHSTNYGTDACMSLKRVVALVAQSYLHYADGWWKRQLCVNGV